MSGNFLDRKSNPEIPVNTIVRIVIVAATLGLAWYWGQSPSYSYLGILVAIVGLLVIFRFPPLGLVSIIPVALLISYSIGTGTQTDLNLAYLSVPIMWVLLFFRNIYYRQDWSALFTRATWPLIGLIITTAVSFVSGYLPWNAFAQQAPIRAQIGAMAMFAFAAGGCLLVPAIIHSERWLQWMVWPFVIIGGVYMVGRAIPRLDVLTDLVLAPAVGSVFWVWLTSMTAGQALFNKKLGYRIRILLGVAVLLIFYVAFVIPENRDWASGWLPAGVALALIIWLRWPKLSVGVGAFIIIAGMLNFRAIVDLLLSGDNAYSLLTRTAAFQILWQIIQINPLLGVGPANYYYYTSLYSLLGYYVRFNSHNQYVDIMAQVGLLGMAFFLWFVVEIGLMGFKLRRLVEPGGFAAAYVAAGLAGLAGMLVAGALGDWLIPFVYNVGVSGFRASLIGWLFLGGIFTLYYLYQQKKAVVAE